MSAWFALDVMAAMLEELKQKNLIVSGVSLPPTWPPRLCHVDPKGLIANQEYFRIQSEVTFSHHSRLFHSIVEQTKKNATFHYNMVEMNNCLRCLCWRPDNLRFVDLMPYY